MKKIVIGLLTLIIIASAGPSGAVCLKTDSNLCAAYNAKSTRQNMIAVTNNAVTATATSTPTTDTTKQPATATSTTATATTKQPATATSTPATATTKQPATATSTSATATTKQPATATSTTATATTKQPATNKDNQATPAPSASATLSPSATKTPSAATSQNIVITMVNRDNQPISKLEVILQDDSNSGYKYYDVTNGEGAVYFPNLPMGTYTMTVNRPDSSYIYSTVMLLEGANESKILESQSSSSGVVRDYDIDINTSVNSVGISFMFKGTFIGIVGIVDNPPIPKDEPAPSSTPAPEPSATPSPSSTPSPAPAPTDEPTANDKPAGDAGTVTAPDLNKPTQMPDAVPTTIPSSEPQAPSAAPTTIPSSEPQAPSDVPTTIPSSEPQTPSAIPSVMPSETPSALPSTAPGDEPQSPSAGQAGTNSKPAPTATNAQNTQHPTVSPTKPPAPQTTSKPVGSASAAPTAVVRPQNTAKPTGQAATTSAATTQATNTPQSQSTVEQATSSAKYPQKPAQLAGTPYLGGTLNNYEGNPIAGAYIDSKNSDTKGFIQGVTDNNGAFMLSGIAAGKHFISVYNTDGNLIGVVELDVVDGDTTEYINNGLTHKLVVDPSDREVYMMLTANGDGGIIVRSAEALNAADDSSGQTRPAFSPAVVIIPVIAACAVIVIFLLLKKRKGDSQA